jgi:hypothetical protein
MIDINDFVSDSMYMLNRYFQNDDTMQNLESSIRKNHVRDGYFSMDGLYDDFCDILQSKEQGRRFYNMIVGA